MGDLLSSLPDGGGWRDIAYVGYFDGDAGLAEGFAEAAEAIFKQWQSSPRTGDQLLLPLVHNYRHALELALKQAIRDAAKRVRFDGHNDPSLHPDELDVHLKRKQRHRLGPLADQLAGLLKELALEGLPADTMRLLARLHQLDPTGEAFRYADHLESSAHAVDVPELTKLLRDAFAIVHGGVITALHVYADYQSDMREMYADYADASNSASF
ncbi:hypothetical protein [Actinomadura viridis]|uniref:Uncharacterized protein n=1 Tax=Actinomadura viridis TaxID=58110 RepID=A0A931DKD2_9ACTN|nr:hypothetical protein [Actinomadura viridis]MBG6092804.1 hypothetical protein [Actinomadura viridis]